MSVNIINFHMNGFALGRALKQRGKATWKLPLGFISSILLRIKWLSHFLVVLQISIASQTTVSFRFAAVRRRGTKTWA